MMKSLGLRTKDLRFSAVNILVLLTLILFAASVQNVQAQEVPAPEKIKMEIIIQVEPSIIALTAGEVAKIPIMAARVRSTELRELNKEYNAVSIEKLYRLKNLSQASEEKSNEEGKDKELKIKEPEILLSTEEKPTNDKRLVDLSRVFTKKLKKEFKGEGKEVKEVENVYILQFESDTQLNMAEILKAYRDLSVIVRAEKITRRK